VSAVQYRETLWSGLFEGSRPSVACLQPAVLAVETALDLGPSGSAQPTSLDLERERRRKRLVWRLDGGFGTDEKLHWLLARQYQVIAKGFSGRRAELYNALWGYPARATSVEAEMFRLVKRRANRRLSTVTT
jgi:hypothetical protein